MPEHQFREVDSVDSVDRADRSDRSVAQSWAFGKSLCARAKKMMDNLENRCDVSPFADRRILIYQHENSMH